VLNEKWDENTCFIYRENKVVAKCVDNVIKQLSKKDIDICEHKNFRYDKEYYTKNMKKDLSEKSDDEEELFETEEETEADSEKEKETETETKNAEKKQNRAVRQVTSVDDPVDIKNNMMKVLNGKKDVEDILKKITKDDKKDTKNDIKKPLEKSGKKTIAKVGMNPKKDLTDDEKDPDHSDDSDEDIEEEDLVVFEEGSEEDNEYDSGTDLDEDNDDGDNE
jgi:hypothetical protein